MPFETPQKKWWPASMISSDEYRFAGGGGRVNAGEASAGSCGGTAGDGCCAPTGAAARPTKTVAAIARRKA